MQVTPQETAHQSRLYWLRKSDILISVVGTVLIAGLILYVFRLDYHTTLDLWKSRLSAEVRYHAWTLQNSLEQSHDDVQVLANFAATRELLQQPTAAARTNVIGLFDNFRKVYEYPAIFLLGPTGEIVVQTKDSSVDVHFLQTSEFQQTFRDALLTQNYRMAIVPASSKELGLIFATPVLSSSGTFSKTQPIGVVVLFSLFSRDILPLLKAGLVPTKTGETVFLQLSSNESRYASPRRFTQNRSSHADTLVLAAAQAVEDRASFGQFIDYRGASVIASMERIPAFNGVVVTKVDDTEAFADFIRTARIEIITAGAAVIAYIGMILLRRRIALAQEMRKTAQALLTAKETLEMKVAQRTMQLAQVNDQLHLELAQRKKAEEEVRRVNSQLEQRVRDRTAQLEAANTELEAFAYSISHDLRAPLRGIHGFSRIISQEYSSQIPSEARQFLLRVDQNAIQMENLINGLLSFSRLGRGPLTAEPVALADLVRDCWRDLSLECAGRLVELVVGDLAPCLGDPLLLKQVFMNLLSNALKYSRTRHIARIEVGTTATGAYYVRDNGVGFDVQYQSKLFGVFQRLHQEEDFEGTGVGLAIVQRIIQRHGGQIWATAAVNVGATFYFTLGGTLPAQRELAEAQLISSQL